MMREKVMVHITDTKTQDLVGVYFEGCDDLVSSETEAWLVYSWYYRCYKYYKTEQEVHDGV